jgi:hypothetical protein
MVPRQSILVDISDCKMILVDTCISDYKMILVDISDCKMMIEVYKIIKGCYDREASSFLKLMNETGLRFSSRINSNKIVHQGIV